MAWIELHQAVWSHRKTFELASALGVDETYAAAHVIRLWCWALDNAPSGDLSGLSDRAIAFGAGWRHEVSLFVGALISTGWLDPSRTIHDWHEYAGRLIERREKDAERKKTARMSPGQPPDVRGTSGGTAAGVRRTGPDPTGPDPTGPDRGPTPQPPPLHAGEGERTNGRRRGVRESPKPSGGAPDLTDASDADRELWDAAREALRAEMSGPNWEQLVGPLVVLGRTDEGGLCLRAPPYSGAVRVRPTVAKALLDAGDERATHAQIIESEG